MYVFQSNLCLLIKLGSVCVVKMGAMFLLDSLSNFLLFGKGPAETTVMSS